MVKLADVATMEYFTSHGQGEVCVKGANVFQVLTSAELHNIFSVCSRAINEPSRSFTVPGEGPYWLSKILKASCVL